MDETQRAPKLYAELKTFWTDRCYEDGSIVSSQLNKYWVYPKATNFWISTGRGFKEKEQWTPGKYWVELYVDKNFSAMGEIKVN